MTKVSLQAEEGARPVKQDKPEEAIREFERALAHDAQDGNALLGRRGCACREARTTPGAPCCAAC
ncbi:hypothetical protein ACN28S_42660 [Cystobacter fuscus]